MKEPVIYWIRNTANGKFYVGSSTQRYVRWRTHKKKLRANTHHCPHLQAAWNKYGEASFEFSVVERVVDEADLHAAEDRWLSNHVGKQHCYNAGRRAGAPMRGRTGAAHPSFGKPRSDAQKEKLRDAALEQWKNSDPRTGRTHSDDSKAKISAKVRQAVAEGRGGCFTPTEETRAKMSAALKGNQCAKGHKRTPVEVEAMRQRVIGNQNWLGKSHSMESRVKMGRGVVATAPDGTETRYDTITMLRGELDLLAPTINRALKANKPLAKGPYKGWSFRYA